MLLEFNKNGIYCEQADVYIDPWRSVKKALITHGHADHARWGHKSYLATNLARPVIKFRLGSHINIQGIDYGEELHINGVKFSFHPAGHIIGSAQIRVEYKGEVWVVSGDYKLENDGLSTPFEPIKCHTFITESTFGLPVYHWEAQQDIFEEINQWWAANKQEGKVSVLAAYALGKAQRLLHHLDTSIGTIYTHGAIENVNKVLRSQGIDLPPTTRVTNTIKKKAFPGSMVLATPGAVGSNWMKRFQPYSTGIASGWMTLRGARRRRAADRGFILSDHADWDGLNQAIKACEAERVVVTHGYTSIYSNWLRENGYEAYEAETQFEGELFDSEEDKEN